MKKRAAVLLAGVLSVCTLFCSCQGTDNGKRGQKSETLKILTIGNSFSDDTMEYVWNIANDLGVKVYLGNLYIGGCTLSQHRGNALGDFPLYEYRTNSKGSWSTKAGTTLREGVEDQDWDYISFQQASGSSGVAWTYDVLGELIGKVKEWAPADVKFVWNMTWAYQQDSTHEEFYKYDFDQATMYECIVDAVQEKVVTNGDISVISPTGTAIQNARTSIFGDSLTRDGYHLSLAQGRFIAGVTFFKAVTGTDVSGLSFRPDSVSEEHLRIAIESANNAINTPFSVTQSSFTE